jgi:membrane protein YqaA with SNARE-associated domain
MVGVIALVLTVSMTIPFASILVVAILLRRDRWKEIMLVSSLGSATGGLILYLTFHYFGWSQIAAVSRLPVSEVFLALFLGKLLKYGVYGWLAAEFPSWFKRFAPRGDTEHRTSALESRSP